MTVEPAELDLGRVAASERRHISIRLTNHADHLLQILAVRSTCGCTVPKLAIDQLASGQVTEMNLFLRVPPEEGEHAKRTVIDYRLRGGSDIQSIQFVLRFRVRAPIQIEPSFLSFVNIRDKGGVADNGIVRLSLTESGRAGGDAVETSESLVVEKAVISKPAFSTNVEPVQDGWLIHVHFDRESYQGPYPLRTYLTIFTNRDDASVINVPIYAARIDTVEGGVR